MVVLFHRLGIASNHELGQALLNLDAFVMQAIYTVSPLNVRHLNIMQDLENRTSIVCSCPI